jgi:hypothetical protein
MSNFVGFRAYIPLVSSHQYRILRGIFPVVLHTVRTFKTWRMRQEWIYSRCKITKQILSGGSNGYNFIQHVKKRTCT